MYFIIEILVLRKSKNLFKVFFICLLGLFMLVGSSGVVF